MLVGVLLRHVLGGGGVGDRSGTLMAVLLAISVWLAARVVGGSRVALAATLACMALFDIAALPARNLVEYDDLQAFYRTDQLLSAHVPVVDQRVTTLTVMAQPMFSGAQPAFGLAGNVNGAPFQWTCRFERGIQRLALPLPPEALRGVAALDVQLRLTGSPTRESDYLLVYASSGKGGFLIALEAPSGASPCVLT